MATEERRASIWKASTWMLVLAILLFWIPVVGPMIAGFVGGRMLGDVGRAVLAAIIPAIVIAALAMLLFSLFGQPLIGFALATLFFIWLAVESIPMVFGAVIGALFGRQVR